MLFKMNQCNTGRKQTITLVRIILKRANKAILHYLIPAAQKPSTDATNMPRMEAVSKGVEQKALNPAEQRSTYTIYS